MARKKGGPGLVPLVAGRKGASPSLPPKTPVEQTAMALARKRALRESARTKSKGSPKRGLVLIPPVRKPARLALPRVEGPPPLGVNGSDDAIEQTGNDINPTQGTTVELSDDERIDATQVDPPDEPENAASIAAVLPAGEAEDMRSPSRTHAPTHGEEGPAVHGLGLGTPTRNKSKSTLTSPSRFLKSPGEKKRLAEIGSLRALVHTQNKQLALSLERQAAQHEKTTRAMQKSIKRMATAMSRTPLPPAPPVTPTPMEDVSLLDAEGDTDSLIDRMADMQQEDDEEEAEAEAPVSMMRPLGTGRVYSRTETAPVSAKATLPSTVGWTPAHPTPVHHTPLPASLGVPVVPAVVSPAKAASLSADVVRSIITGVRPPPQADLDEWGDKDRATLAFFFRFFMKNPLPHDHYLIDHAGLGVESVADLADLVSGPTDPAIDALTHAIVPDGAPQVMVLRGRARRMLLDAHGTCQAVGVSTRVAKAVVTDDQISSTEIQRLQQDYVTRYSFEPPTARTPSVLLLRKLLRSKVNESPEVMDLKFCNPAEIELMARQSRPGASDMQVAVVGGSLAITPKLDDQPAYKTVQPTHYIRNLMVLGTAMDIVGLVRERAFDVHVDAIRQKLTQYENAHAKVHNVELRMRAEWARLVAMGHSWESAITTTTATRQDLWMQFLFHEQASSFASRTPAKSTKWGGDGPKKPPPKARQPTAKTPTKARPVIAPSPGGAVLPGPGGPKREQQDRQGNPDLFWRTKDGQDRCREYHLRTCTDASCKLSHTCPYKGCNASHRLKDGHPKKEQGGK